jgi:hypothetical protein
MQRLKVFCLLSKGDTVAHASLKSRFGPVMKDLELVRQHGEVSWPMSRWRLNEQALSK